MAFDFRGIDTLVPDTQRSLEAVFQDPWASLRDIHPVAAGILVIIGLALLLWGFRIYKGIVILAYGIVGLYLGAVLAEACHFSILIGMIGGALILGTLAWPLYLIGWSLLGGAALAGLAAMTAANFTSVMAYVIVAATVGGVLGVVLTVLLMRSLIILVTSIAGAVVLLEGALRLTLLAPSAGEPILKTLSERQLAQAAIVAIPAFVGILLQFTDKSGKGGGKGGERKPKKEEQTEK
jgi:hypothetical protein